MHEVARRASTDARGCGAQEGSSMKGASPGTTQPGCGASAGERNRASASASGASTPVTTNAHRAKPVASPMKPGHSRQARQRRAASKLGACSCGEHSSRAIVSPPVDPPGRCDGAGT
ncbi:hypothetical protein Anae109_1026 [Anaeromyxobacter sp. Fw109-5]|nr:hypothetical protein Anae109_1026 [Anaeromyxobacter sp. Fw109-5]